MEKIHGTSAHLKWNDGNLHLYSGGESSTSFSALFNVDKIKQLFSQLSLILDCKHIIVYGEAYGGKQQRNAWRYGPNLKFVAFEVFADPKWLTVPEAEKAAKYLGLEFVHYVRIPTKLELIDAERDAISEQAIRNGVTTRDGEFIRREGVVLRTVDEKVDRFGNRILAKHKRAEERETKTERKVDDTKVQLIKEGNAIAEEYVTEMRLCHVLQKLPPPEINDMTRTREVISAMITDVEKEAGDEIVMSEQARAAIGRATAKLLKKHLEESLRNENRG